MPNYEKEVKSVVGIKEIKYLFLLPGKRRGPTTPGLWDLKNQRLYFKFVQHFSFSIFFCKVIGHCGVITRVSLSHLSPKYRELVWSITCHPTLQGLHYLLPSSAGNTLPATQPSNDNITFYPALHKQPATVSHYLLQSPAGTTSFITQPDQHYLLTYPVRTTLHSAQPCRNNITFYLAL